MILHRRFSPDHMEMAYQVHQAQHGMRLDRFVGLFKKGISREAIKKKIRSGEVAIRGRSGRQRPNTRVRLREIVQFTIKKTTHEDEYWQGRLLELEQARVLHEDDQIVVLAKPPYMATHPTGRHLFHCATVFLEQKTASAVYPLHRLDRETSGILLLAKDARTASRLAPLFERERVKKGYFFIADKRLSFSGSHRFDASERLGSRKTTLRDRVYVNAYPPESNRGKRAKTHFRLLIEAGDHVMGLAFPQTGRQHQIRVHAMAHGLPLIGDKLYCGSYAMFQRFKDLKATPEDHRKMQIPRQALHAVAINFRFKAGERTFVCPLPRDLRDWILDRHQPRTLAALEGFIAQEVENYFSG